MGELIFIGLGLHDESGISLRGQVEAGECDQIFTELYTSVMPGLNLERLSRTVGKPIQVLSRRDIEEDADRRILSKAKAGKVAFLVAGDPMVATTHVDLRLRAHRAGIGTRIIHGASVASAAAGVAGLQSNKFGRTVTIPISRNGELPESVYDTIATNCNIGLHTLILLEMDVESKRHVSIPQAIEQLLELSSRRAGTLLKSQTLVVGLARLGSPDMAVRAATAFELKSFDFGNPPHCLILPGKLHFVEVEALEAFCGATKTVVGIHT